MHNDRLIKCQYVTFLIIYCQWYVRFCHLIAEFPFINKNDVIFLKKYGSCILSKLKYFKILYSTSLPSGNQVDGLPLVLHNTRLLVSGVPLLSALFWYIRRSMYCGCNNYDCCDLKYSEHIQDSIKIIRFYWVWAQDESKTTVFMVGQRTPCFLVFRFFHFLFELYTNKIW